jgi:hypothetical protein
MSGTDDTPDDEPDAEGGADATRSEVAGPIIAERIEDGRTLFAETDHSNRWIETDLTVEINP